MLFCKDWIRSSSDDLLGHAFSGDSIVIFLAPWRLGGSIQLLILISYLLAVG